MPNIWYVDPEGGNNANDGTSFAQRWRDSWKASNGNGVVAGDTIRFMGSPDPTSLGQTALWTDCADYRTKPGSFNINGATNATPIVLDIPGHPFVTNDIIIVWNVAGNTNANGTWKVTVSGNNVTLLGSTGNGAFSAGYCLASCKTSEWVQLTSAVTKNICVGNRGYASSPRPSWTANANVTVNHTSDLTTIEGDGAEEIVVGSSFTTGIAAYANITSLNLSAYQGVCFSIKQTLGTVIAAGDMELVLCTAVAGGTVVHHIPVPAFCDYTNFSLTASNWIPVTWNNGSNLNAAILSVALNILTDQGAVTVQLTNIFAVKDVASADSLRLDSLISKNTGNPEQWWAVRAINEVLGVNLDCGPNQPPFAGLAFGGYVGVTENVTTYKRNTTKVNYLWADGGQSAAGYYGVTYSGGWDRTNMSAQSLDGTWLDASYNWCGSGLASYYGCHGTTVVEKMNFARFYNTPFVFWFDSPGSLTINGTLGVTGVIHGNGAAVAPYNNFCSFGTINVNSVSGNGIGPAVLIYNPATGTTINVSSTYGSDAVSLLATSNDMSYRMNVGAVNIGCAGGMAGLLQEGGYIGSVNIRDSQASVTGNVSGGSIDESYAFDAPTIGAVNLSYNYGTTMQFSQGLNIGTLNADHNTDIGVWFNQPFVNINIFGGTIGNTTGTAAGVALNAGSGGGYIIGGGFVNFKNVVLNDSTEVRFSGNGSDLSNIAGLSSHNHDNTADNHKIFWTAGLIQAQTTTRHTASGLAWQFSPTSSTVCTAYNPLILPLARIAVNANALVTVKCWMRRTDTGLTLKLVAKGGQLNGVGTLGTVDVSNSMTVAANTWEEVTITFTPTEVGVVLIEAQCYGGTTYSGYVDDMTVTQA